jgi:hypothetical protein
MESLLESFHCIVVHYVIVSSFLGFDRVREAIVRVSGRQPRPPPIHRHTYYVPGPNALWHLDGNHKLIRWKFVFHGAIDGYSRLITYLKCSSNNYSETVLTEGIQKFGMPSRIRTDHGGENVRVWDFMEHNRGSGRNSFIAGRSVHNTRIEGLWRDVTRLCHRHIYLFSLT